MRWNADDMRTLFLRLPNGIARFYAETLCLFAFCKHNASARFFTAANSDCFARKLGVKRSFNRGVKIIQVGMNYNAFHTFIIHKKRQK